MKDPDSLALNAVKQVAYTLCFSGFGHHVVLCLACDISLDSCASNFSVPLPACPPF